MWGLEEVLGEGIFWRAARLADTGASRSKQAAQLSRGCSACFVPVVFRGLVEPCLKKGFLSQRCLGCVRDLGVRGLDWDVCGWT